MSRLSRMGVLTLGLALGGLFVITCTSSDASHPHRHKAQGISYDPLVSGLAAANLQDAVNKIVEMTNSMDTRLSTLEGDHALLDTKVAGLQLHDHVWVVPPTDICNSGSCSGPFDLSAVLPPDAEAVMISYNISCGGTTCSTRLTMELGGVTGQASNTGPSTGLYIFPYSAADSTLTISAPVGSFFIVQIIAYTRSWTP